MSDLKSVWVVTTDNTIFGYSTKFFSTEDKAKAHLKSIAKDRKYKMGVDVIVDTDIEFAFIFGWEEHKVSFRAKEVPLDGN